jgi:hypothetical protein
VVRAHLAFAVDARRLGHEHGPWDWTPEVSHSMSEGERVVVDAVLCYTVVKGEQRRKLRAFVEVDRATMSGERLAVKLIEYARLHQYEAQPAGWRRRGARLDALVPGSSPACCSSSPAPPAPGWRAGSATCRR